MINQESVCGKTVYNDRPAALSAIVGMNHDRGSDKANKQPNKTYFCKPCNGWHIFTEGKKKKMKGKSKEQSLKHDQPLSIQSSCKKWTPPLIIHDARKFKIK